MFLGVASGVPFDLVSSTGTLQLALSSTGVDINVIGLFGLIALAYVAKPIWSPLIDRWVPSPVARLGRRRGWMVIALAGLVVGALVMATANPRIAPEYLAFAALLVAFFSATFDIVVDGYRTELLQPNERGVGVALGSAGYRLGMLLAGGLAPIIAQLVAGPKPVNPGYLEDHYYREAMAQGWAVAFAVMAAVMALGLIAALWAPREPEIETVRPSLRDAFVKPLADLLARKSAITLLSLVLLYRVCDSFGSSQYGTFLERELGFETGEIGALRKAIGAPSILAGMFVGGIFMVRFRLWHTLVVFGFLQALSNLLLVVQAGEGRSYETLTYVLVADNFCGGLANVAFLSLVTALCNVRFAATQFALLASLAQLGRALGGPLSGPTQSAFGWDGFFIVSTLVFLPALVLLIVARRSVLALDAPSVGRDGPGPARDEAVG